MSICSDPLDACIDQADTTSSLMPPHMRVCVRRGVGPGDGDGVGGTGTGVGRGVGAAEGVRVRGVGRGDGCAVSTKAFIATCFHLLSWETDCVRVSCLCFSRAHAAAHRLAPVPTNETVSLTPKDGAPDSPRGSSLMGGRRKPVWR